MEIPTTGGPAVTPAVYADQVQQQPVQQQFPQVPTGTASGETLILILCGSVVVMAWRKSKAMRWPVVAALVVGTLMAGSVAGAMIKQTSGSAGTQMEQMVNGFNGGGAGTAPSGYRPSYTPTP